jgi:ribonucleoside-triphosphate reductase
MKVEKRDGTLQEFDFQKIVQAVKNVYKSIGKEGPEKVMFDLCEYYRKLSEKYDSGKNTQPVPIESIQDTIRDILIKRNQIEAAEAFVLYRKKHEEIRERKSWMTKEITKKLKGTNIENQNANVDEASFGGRLGEATRVVTKDFALKYIVSKKSRDNHNNNMIYIHDLDSYAVGMHNCLTIPFDDLLKKGFEVRQTDVRPANSINTAFQLVAVIFQVQSLQQFGGVSASHLDWTMVPYVRKSFYKHYKTGLKYLHGIEEVHVVANIEGDVSIEDESFKVYPKAYQYAIDMTEKECKQAVEGMYHNLNTLQSRSGNQLPFTSINYGTCTLPEGRMVTKYLLEVSCEGLGKFGRTSIFPCGIFQYMKGVNDKPGTPNYDLKQLALKSTSKRLYPNYANIDWSGNSGYDRNDPRTYFSTMGCRTANGFDINGLGQLKDGRGNICPVTIILPTLAKEVENKVNKYLSNRATNEEYMKEFLIALDKKIHEAKDMLLERFSFIASQSPASARFMYDNNTMAGYVPEEGIISALKHGTLSLGQLGVAEALQILIGCDHTTEEGMKYAKQIEELYKTRCAEFKKEYQLNFGVYYTPAESLCYTAFEKWKAKYGDYPGVTYYIDENGNRVDKKYFTNSMHVPVYKKMSPFEKIDIESQLTGYSSAGCITYIEVKHDVIHNTEALEEMVDYAMEKDIPYFAINLPNDMCNDCGYTGLIDEKCPKCGKENISRLRRVTGYLTGDYKSAFNEGKQTETEQRVIHNNETNF